MATLLVAGALAMRPGAAQDLPGWQQHVLPASDSTKLIAVGADAERGTVGVLYTDAAPGRDGQLRVATLDATGKELKSLDAGGRGEPLREHAGVAVDANGVVYVAAGEAGGVRLSRLDQRGTVAPLGRPLATGAGATRVNKLLLAPQGRLLVVGDAGGIGFAAAVSPQGQLLWRRSFDDTVTVFDAVATDDGFIVAGGTAGDMFPAAVWLARLGADGAVLQQQERAGPTRYAHLASDGRRIGLLYERLDSTLEAGKVVLELFGDGAALRQPAAQTLFEGRLTAPFVLAGAGGRFTAAGIAQHGRLQVVDVDASGKAAPLYAGKAKAPDYVRYHSVALARTPGAVYLAGLRSQADGPRRRYELAVIAGR